MDDLKKLEKLFFQDSGFMANHAPIEGEVDYVKSQLSWYRQELASFELLEEKSDVLDLMREETHQISCKYALWLNSIQFPKTELRGEDIVKLYENVESIKEIVKKYDTPSQRILLLKALERNL